MTLGKSVWTTKFSNADIFGGDMFKLNAYNTVLDPSEIRSMATNICSSKEMSLTSIRIIKWEEILSNERTGNITEIPSPCNYDGIHEGGPDGLQSQTRVELNTTKDELTTVKSRKEKSKFYFKSLILRPAPVPHNFNTD